MSFTEKDKLKALAIVHIFETSKPFGEYSACVVLNDGAGVSYGINQFTHRSGSLFELVKCYLEKGGKIGRAAIEESLPLLRQKSAGAVGELSGNARFKKALKAAAVTREMREAQHEIAEKRYLKPAIEAAVGSGFTLPLSLAVIYDSINHGSYARIRDRVKIARRNYASDTEFEKAWIYSYVKNRDAWLESVPRLAVTDYRTDFFLAQIARGNWTLELPVNVHGEKLERVESRVASEEEERGRVAHETAAGSAAVQKDSTVEPSIPSINDPSQPEKTSNSLPGTSENIRTSAQPPDVFSVGSADILSASGAGESDGVVSSTEGTGSVPSASAGGPGPNILVRAEEMIDKAGTKFDRVSDVVSGISTRKDAAKSMWTTVGSTIWQSLWAVIAFIIGLPREVWLTVAIIAGLFMLYYLYRQISLGKIREKAGL
jgi:chitosanase